MLTYADVCELGSVGQQVAELGRERCVLHKAALRLRHVGMGKVWDGWKELAAKLHRVRTVIFRILKQRLSRAFQRWSTSVLHLHQARAQEACVC